MDSYFPASYSASRARFLQEVEPVRTRWPISYLETLPLAGFPDLSIDWVWAVPQHKDNLVIVSTGQHGIEGYIGSAMLKIFMDEFAPRLNPARTGLLLIHAINPWGMQNNRKVNENGVDLNRNFIPNGVFDQSINPDFSKLTSLLAPEAPVRPFWLENLLFSKRTLQAILYPGIASLTVAALLGQYKNSRAMYYGGSKIEDQTVLMQNLLRQALEEYQLVLHLDQHSGYGPRYQMSITVVPEEPLTSDQLAQKFNFPLVLRGDREEFYEIHGDMVTYLYHLREKVFPTKNIFSCAFEYGTFGSSILDRIRSLRAMVFESQLYNYGAQDQVTAVKIHHEFRELYFPEELRWREKALADCRQGYEGILQSYGLLQSAG